MGAVGKNAVQQPPGAVVVVADFQVLGVGFGHQAIGAVVLVGGLLALVVGLGLKVPRRVVGPNQGPVQAAVGFGLQLVLGRVRVVVGHRAVWGFDQVAEGVKRPGLDAVVGQVVAAGFAVEDIVSVPGDLPLAVGLLDEVAGFVPSAGLGLVRWGFDPGIDDFDHPAQVVVTERGDMTLGVGDAGAVPEQIVAIGGDVVLRVLALGEAIQFIVSSAFRAALGVDRLVAGVGGGTGGVGVDHAGEVAVGVVLEAGLIAQGIDDFGQPPQRVVFAFDGLAVGVGDADRFAPEVVFRLGAVGVGVDGGRPAVHGVVFVAGGVARLLISWLIWITRLFAAK